MAAALQLQIHDGRVRGLSDVGWQVARDLEWLLQKRQRPQKVLGCVSTAGGFVLNPLLLSMDLMLFKALHSKLQLELQELRLGLLQVVPWRTFGLLQVQSMGKFIVAELLSRILQNDDSFFLKILSSESSTLPLSLVGANKVLNVCTKENTFFFGWACKFSAGIASHPCKPSRPCGFSTACLLVMNCSMPPDTKLGSYFWTTAQVFVGLLDANCFVGSDSTRSSVEQAGGHWSSEPV